MTIEALTFLNSPEGKQLLEEYHDLGETELPRLALKLAKKKIPFAAELITLLTARQKAQSKFNQADQMFFTSDGLLQSSDERMSQYIAERFTQKLPAHAHIIDLTCGIGGNSIFLAQHFTVTTIDIDPVHLYCAKQNASAYNVAENINFVEGRAEDNITDADAFLIDPQRIRSGQTKTRSLHNSQPNIMELLPEMFKITRNICIKISPAFDYAEIAELPETPEIELVSENNTNKSALLWFGDFKTCERRATMIDNQKIVSYTNQENEITATAKPIQKYIFIVNKAITKARLLHEIAEKYDLNVIRSTSEILTADHLPSAPSKVMRSFEVVEQCTYSKKLLRDLLQRHHIDRAHIIAKQFPIHADELRREYKLKEGGEYTLIFTTLSANDFYILLTKKVT
jgi:hypothetical protein